LILIRQRNLSVIKNFFGLLGHTVYKVLY